MFAAWIDGRALLEFPTGGLILAGRIQEAVVVLIGFPDRVQGVGRSSQPGLIGSASIQGRRGTSRGRKPMRLDDTESDDRRRTGELAVADRVGKRVRSLSGARGVSHSRRAGLKSGGAIG